MIACAGGHDSKASAVVAQLLQDLAGLAGAQVEERRGEVPASGAPHGPEEEMILGRTAISLSIPTVLSLDLILLFGAGTQDTQSIRPLTGGQ